MSEDMSDLEALVRIGIAIHELRKIHNSRIRHYWPTLELLNHVHALESMEHDIYCKANPDKVDTVAENEAKS